MKKNSFVILTPGFPKDENDTTCIPALQRFVLQLHKQHRELDLHVISFQYPPSDNTYLWHGITVHPVGGMDSKGVHRIATWMKVCFLFVEVYLQGPVRGILSIWLTECALLGQFLGRLFSVREVSWASGQDARSTNRYLPFLDIDNDHVITIAPRLSHQLAANGYPQVNAIPLGLDAAYIDALPRAAIGYDIIGVGSLSELKNYQVFIRLVMRLQKDHPGIRTAIVGDGPQRTELEKWISYHDMNAYVELKGKLPHPEVVGLMKSGRILLHPASYEGQGMVLHEAAYCGMEVVCFDTGLNFPEHMHVCRDEEEMFQQLRKLVINGSRRTSSLVAPMEKTVKQVMHYYAL